MCNCHVDPTLTRTFVHGMKIHIEVCQPAFGSNDRIDTYHFDARVETSTHMQFRFQSVQIIQILPAIQKLPGQTKDLSTEQSRIEPVERQVVLARINTLCAAGIQQGSSL